jgi:carbonic anhydrase/acetyltransferase-like protein (isoleucine patch superfamily)
MPIYAIDGVKPVLPADDRYFVAPDAHVIGNVRIGADVGIWFGAVIRGDNEPIEIGERTNIQEMCMLHTDPGAPMVIGADCTIGHKVILHGCRIGSSTLIGMGSTILNHAKIGNNCLVGANSLVTEGKEFPDNSLIVGAPARAVRTLDEAAIARLRLSAAHYVQNAYRFRTGLTPVG